MQVTYRTQVGASATVANALADTNLERAPGWGFLSIYGRHETTSTGEIVVTLYQGDTLVVDEGTMTANDAMAPNKQDDIIAGPLPVVPGQQLRAVLRETTGAATDLRVVFEFTEAPMAVVMAALGG